ncbi:MAG: AbrB/MazE/SpoVT family DNA-binding domain-containing protein [Selenomonadales bacterium]|nr:AbrB/MazE/SpoVT family DNA-binding domain-containing protein [Selenomonadales bacterium]
MEGTLVNLAKVSANGQITVPIEIRRKLMLKEGDKVLFIQRENGEIVINNASATAILRAQKAFEGVAESMGVEDENDVQNLINEVRYGNTPRQ